MSDRKEFQTARDAGLKQRHEQRLARSAHYNEAVKAAAVAIGRTFNGDPLTWRAEAEAAVEAALPHLRAYQIEVQTRIGYALGRKEAAEEIATAILATATRYGDSRQRDVVYDMERLTRGVGKDAAQPAVCRRCFHTAHEDVGECRACYCRSATSYAAPDCDDPTGSPT